LAAREKELDVALETAFRTNPAFCDWFLSRTKFSQGDAKYDWSRSDHPWGRIPFSLGDPATRIVEGARDCETDVLVVFATSKGQRFPLHIENKLAAGRFEAHQPELYTSRGRHWLRNPDYGNYEDFESVLVAPRVFYDRNREIVDKHFDHYIAHEDIAAFIPLFA
jgi:hypothetical protein